MTELGSLFLIVFALYIVQCVCWVNPDSVVFALGLRDRGKKKSRGLTLSGLDTAAFLANPLPPLSPLLVTHWPAFQLNPDSVLISGPNGEATSITWETLVVTRSGSRLLFNGTSVFKGDETQVLGYCQLLQQLRQATRPQRERAIEKWLREGLDSKASARRLQVFQRRSLWIRIVSNLQFFFLFFLLPFAIGIYPRMLRPAIILVVATSVILAIEFWSVHRKLYKKTADTRFTATFTIALSPLAAIRTCDTLCRNLVAGYHPVAVAAAICTDAAFEAIAGEQLRYAKFTSASDWYQKKLVGLIEQVIRQRGLEPRRLLTPSSQMSGCILYCPRCLTQYVTNREECSDCGHKALVAFTSSGTGTSFSP